MIVEAQCKFCHKPLHLEIDDGYAAAPGDEKDGPLGDPYKLLRLACCNRCGDYYVERRRIFERVKHLAMKLFGGAVEKDELPKMREVLTALIKRYMRLLADYKQQDVPDWDEEIINGIMQKPGNYMLILKLIPRMFAQPKLV